MVSIMRPEQTLRLIQLYHSHYPEIARNNQDADGRNQKLQMWATITEELNIQFDTLFTVEQYKKKVQNVQCTSRQKLFNGKRNLGEAEVEYLRLFESDKINEETLYLRAKGRVGPLNNDNIKCLSLPPGEFDSIIQTPSRELSEGLDSNDGGSFDGINNDLRIRLYESRKLLKGWNEEMTTLNKQQEKETTTIMVRDEINKNNSENNNNLIKTTNNQQTDSSAQQFLLALLNATLDNVGNDSHSNNNLIEESLIDKLANLDNLKKKRKNLNQKEGITLSPSKRSRKLEKPIRTLEENIEQTGILMEDEGITKNNLLNKNLHPPPTTNNQLFNNQQKQEEEQKPNTSTNIQLNNLQFEQICGKIDKTNFLLNKIIELINERLPKNNNEGI
uniref:Regulatory protein zeste n=1 Tax=Meloidogyne floridensis TaxID=298350 RepID=A0A915NWG2_9BILA